MRRGVSSWICLASLAAGGCASTQTAELKIRAIPNAAAKLRPGSALLADAAGQLAIGNVGLAIEGFRKALREQPNSAEAYAGLAKCYEAMGRYDLARANYEAALALTPRDPRLLTAVAVALDQQGETEAAKIARQEAAAIAPVAQLQLPQPGLDTNAPVALSSSVTVKLPPARPAEMHALTSSVTVDLPPPHPVYRQAPLAEHPLPQAPINQEAAVALVSTGAVQPAGGWSDKLVAALASNIDFGAPEVPLPLPQTDRSVLVALDSTQAVSATDGHSAMVESMRTSSIELSESPVQPKWTPLAPLREPALPQPRTSQSAAVALESTSAVHSAESWSAKLLRAFASNIDLNLPQPRPLSEAGAQPATKPSDPERGPYLERLSSGEVALVTDGRPAWRAQVVAQNRTSAKVRWVPIMSADARPNIRILNAAKRQGIAAVTRNVLLDRGWRKIQIGDAAQTRDRSIVFYPASRRTLGRRLAAQFGFASQMRSDAGPLIVLLGRDAQRGGTKRRG